MNQVAFDFHDSSNAALSICLRKRHLVFKIKLHYDEKLSGNLCINRES
jgi:hypothetical protein